MSEDFGDFGDEFRLGGCQDDWGTDDLQAWEEEQVFQDGVLERQAESEADIEIEAQME